MKNIRRIKEKEFENCVSGLWMKLVQFKGHPKCLTPMAIALRNGNISGIVDIKNDGLTELNGNGGIF